MERTQLKVVYHSRTYTTREGDPNDQWDRGNTSTDHSVTGLVVGEDYHGLYLDGEVKPGDTVWLVYAVYSTGDSFGHDQDKCIEFFTVHRDESVAKFNARALAGYEPEKDFSQREKFFLSLDNGEQFQTVPPWSGYFESLSYVQADPFVIGAGTPNTYLPKRNR